jgi:hypothetical protein
MIIALYATAAGACSFVGPTAFVASPSDDVAAPTGLTLGAVDVTRGQGPRGFFGGVITSCDDVGFIGLDATATDDRTAAAALAYRVVLVEGALPDGLVLPDGPMVYPTPGRLDWVWVDGATDDQEPFAFTLEVVALDEAGNVSEPAEVAIEHAGSTGGCSTSVGVASLGLALIGALGTRRRGTRIPL